MFFAHKIAQIVHCIAMISYAPSRAIVEDTTPEKRGGEINWVPHLHQNMAAPSEGSSKPNFCDGSLAKFWKDRI